MKQGESRFGFGQLVGTVGVILLGVGVSQPWLQFSVADGFEAVLKDSPVNTKLTQEVLYAGSNPAQYGPSSDNLAALARDLGVFSNGLAQNEYLGGAVIAAAVIAMIGILRSFFSRSAFAARSNSPLLALSAITNLVVAGVQLWVLSPEPREAMHPDTGLWLLVAGAAFLMLGAITLGNNRKRWNLDDEFADREHKTFEGTDHLVYSHGAWVPRTPADRERQSD